MTALVLAALACLALLDGAFSGFRASLGRSGLVDHAADDRRALRAGTVLVAVLAAPAAASLLVDVSVGHGELADYRTAGLAFLAVVGPYAVIVLAALVVYRALRWELRYLASAVILGPFTLVRPYVVVAAAVVAVTRAWHPGLAVTAVLAVAAVLLVEPILDRRISYRASELSV